MKKRNSEIREIQYRRNFKILKIKFYRLKIFYKVFLHLVKIKT